MKRSEAIKIILSSLEEHDLALFTTGMISREAFGISDRKCNFYMLGSMGLLSSFGLGLAIQLPRRVVVIEGDGSFLMSLGTVPLIGAMAPRNLFHVVLDNHMYESTGGQPCISESIDLSDIARSSGYGHIFRVESSEGLQRSLESFFTEGPSFLHVDVESGRVEAPRVGIPPTGLRDRFREQLL